MPERAKNIINQSEEIKEKPELFSSSEFIKLNPGQRIKWITIKVSVEGCYMENGKYKVAEDEMFKPNGFDRMGNEEFWTARACMVIVDR